MYGIQAQEKLFLCESAVAAISYFIHYDILLQNAFDLLQNATVILIQISTKVYYKRNQVTYYQMRRLLQNATLQTVGQKSSRFCIFIEYWKNLKEKRCLCTFTVSGDRKDILSFT